MPRTPLTRLPVVLLVFSFIAAGCGGDGSHHHHHDDDSLETNSPPPAAEIPPPPPIEQTRQQVADRVEPLLSSKIRQRLNTSQIKQKLVLAVAVPTEEPDPIVTDLIDRLKADPALTDDFAIVASYSAASDEIPPGLIPPPSPNRPPDARMPQAPALDPDDIYVLTLRYTEDRGDEGDATFKLRCRLTHPQTRELILQMTPSYRQRWDGAQWRLEP